MSDHCRLCDAAGTVRPAGFQQYYRQKHGNPAVISWWECRNCRGWFADPPPPPDVIRANWGVVAYADWRQDQQITEDKGDLSNRVLASIARRGSKGTLLDAGCAFGTFMAMAKAAGWDVAGYDPNPESVRIARDRGLDVREGWTVAECGFCSGKFDAITAIDSFYYSWWPYQDLREFARLLRPGGVLAMRVSNKRCFLGMVRAVLPGGRRRNAVLSRFLQGQFHTVGMRSLQRALEGVGFAQIYHLPHATTAPLRSCRWSTRIAYGVADAVRYATFNQFDLSPGVLLFARKDAGGEKTGDACPPVTAAAG